MNSTFVQPSNGRASSSNRIPPATSVKRPATSVLSPPSTTQKQSGSRSSSVISSTSSATNSVPAANRFSKDFRTPRQKPVASGRFSTALCNSTKVKAPMTSTPLNRGKLDRSSTLHSTPSSNGTTKLPPLSVNGKSLTSNPNPTPRKGLAKFANPIECQRQFRAMTLKIQQLSASLETKNKDIDSLRKRLEHSITVGTGYAVIVQNFAQKLKLDKPVDLVQECRYLNVQVKELQSIISKQDEKFDNAMEEFSLESQKLLDDKMQIQVELERTKDDHEREICQLNKSHTNQLEVLNARIAELEEELESKNLELNNLGQDFENLKLKYDTIEDSLTKDSDYRMRHIKDKMVQLEKEVDSLNVVLNLRQQRIHELEKENLAYNECKNDLSTHKEVIKSLNQQLESVNAALDRKREHCRKLALETERLREELEHENQEKQKIAMRTEQLEYSLTENCQECQ